MSRTKILIIGLIVLSFLFAVTLRLGHVNRQSQPEEPQSYAEAGSFPGWSEGIAGLLAPLSPKVQLKRGTNTYQTGDSLTVSSGAGSGIVLTVSPSDRPFRIATFERQSGQLRLLYQDGTDEAESLNLDEQSIDLPHRTRGDRASLVALKQGGMLQIVCEGSVQCHLVLQ